MQENGSLLYMVASQLITCLLKYLLKKKSNSIKFLDQVYPQIVNNYDGIQ